MATPRKGTVEPWIDAKGRTRYRARIHLADGSRPRYPVPDRCRTPQARSEWAQFRQEQEDRDGALLRAKLAKAMGVTSPGGVETVSDYAKRWLAARTGRVASVRDNQGHLNEHILPVIGADAMALVTSQRIEDVVAALDAKVRGGELSAKTAKNVWGTCSKLFDDATHSKPAEGLRCLAKDPTDGVRGPDDNDADKLLQFLYPSELETFLECAVVPLHWRRNAAIAVYLCLRDGEQRALKWPAVDLEHGVVTIQETYDRRTSADREGTKSGAARMVPIRAELLPLLVAMHAEAKAACEPGEEPRGHVCRMPSLRDMARGLRRWLDIATVTRKALHKGTSVSKTLRWHDLRASGATYLAVEGRSPMEIRDILGHTQTSMTDRYVRAAAVLRGGRFGQPFPPLPPGLLGGTKKADRGPHQPTDQPIKLPNAVILSKISCGADGTRTRGLRRDRPAL